MRDYRTVNQSTGQMVEAVKVIKRIGDISYRDFGVFSKNIFDSGKLLVSSGLLVTPVSGMTVQIALGNGIQRNSQGENFPFLMPAHQNITMDAASGISRIDMLQMQVQPVTTKSDITRYVPDPTTGVILPTTVYRDIQMQVVIQKIQGSTTPTPATAGILTGTASIPSTLDLSTAYKINICDGEDGAFQEVNLQGATPTATTKSEIVAAINAALGRTAASISGNYIVMTGNGVGVTSYFEFKPTATTEQDAITLVFGLSSSGLYSYTYQGTNDWCKIAEIDIGAATTVITAGMIRDFTQSSTWTGDATSVISVGSLFDNIGNSKKIPISNGVVNTDLNADLLDGAHKSTDGTFASLVDTLVPTVKAVSEFVLSNIPVGSILMFGAASPPAGYLNCDGSVLLRVGTYAELFAKIGTTYGSTDSSNFLLPNYNAVVPKGVGSQTINGRGKSGPAFAGLEEDQGQIHNHSVPFYWNVISGAAGVFVYQTLPNAAGTTSGNPGTVAGYSGVRVGDTTRENSLGTNFIIKYK